MIVDSGLIGFYTCLGLMDSGNSSGTSQPPRAPQSAEERSPSTTPPDAEQQASTDQQQLDNEEFRTVIRSSRYTPKEWEIAQQRAAAAGLSPSRFMRHATLGVSLGRRANHGAVVALNRIGVNLNNMVRIALRSGQPFIAAEADEVFKLIRETIQSLL
jgi:hypothetical protein